VEDLLRVAGVEDKARRERSVSCTPGAEGAEFSGVECVGWACGGMKRRDWVSVLVWLLD
jgi:hypothetical protein